MEAVAKTIDRDKPLVIQCPKCQGMNTEHARRCIGMLNDSRCDYYFEFKACPNQQCKAMNDIAARHCRVCETEVIDPNDKLSMKNIKSEDEWFEVVEAKYGITGTDNNFRINVSYACRNIKYANFLIREFYTPKSDKAKRVFYGQFIKKHLDNPSDWYMKMDNLYQVKNMLQSVNTPNFLIIDKQNNKIKKKIFDENAFDRFQDVG
jgi:hypothetical protein